MANEVDCPLLERGADVINAESIAHFVVVLDGSLGNEALVCRNAKDSSECFVVESFDFSEQSVSECPVLAAIQYSVENDAAVYCPLGPQMVRKVGVQE